MTAQYSDGVWYREKPYALTEPENLLDPKRYGLSPVSWCTACWRGYLCDFTVEDGRLYLMSLILGVDEKGW